MGERRDRLQRAPGAVTYDDLPERWASYEPTPEPEREHIEIRTLGSPYCLCGRCDDGPPPDLARRRWLAEEIARNRAVPNPMLTRGPTPDLPTLLAPYVAAEADRIATEARAMMPRTGALPDLARGGVLPKPRKPPGDDPRAGWLVPPIWHDDGTVTLWHPNSPGVRVTVHPAPVRRLLRFLGLHTSAFASHLETTRAFRAPAPRIPTTRGRR